MKRTANAEGPGPILAGQEQGAAVRHRPLTRSIAVDRCPAIQGENRSEIGGVGMQSIHLLVAAPGRLVAEFQGQKVNSVSVNEARCMFCGNCYTMCPSMPLADTEGDGIVLMAGGKISNRIDAPKFSKVVVAFIPNEMPRWPTMTATIRKMVDTYASDARKYERLGQWAERIGWEKFFDKCGLEFTHHLIDDFRDPAYYTWRQSTNFKFT